MFFVYALTEYDLFFEKSSRVKRLSEIARAKIKIYRVNEKKRFCFLLGLKPLRNSTVK